MTFDNFANHPKIKAIFEEINQKGLHEKHFSDVLDDEGNQYVDLVQEGGGTLGIALVGYVYVLEQIGIRFFGLAGTSAGAINALFLASLGTYSEKKSKKLIEILTNKNFYDFIDGGTAVRGFIDELFGRSRWLVLFWRGRVIWKNFIRRLGLNKGEALYDWISKELEKVNIKTTADLLKHRSKLPNLYLRKISNENDLDGLSARLAIISSDITTQSKVEFPQMCDIYWKDAEELSPAVFVRTSMSIPFFFEPFKVRNLPNEGNLSKMRFYTATGYSGEIPSEVTFVDGGVMSNFPIDAFHQKRRNIRLPTFGVKLGNERKTPNIISNPLKFMLAIYDSARNVHDYEFIKNHPEYRLLVKDIDVGDHNWIDFNVSEEKKMDLFIRGAKAAMEFLEEFDWEKYKYMRKETFDKY